MNQRNRRHSTDLHPSPPIPAAFADPSRRPSVALVRGLSEGDFAQRYLAGAQSMADQLGVTLIELSVRGDSTDMIALLEAAIELKVDAIAIDHGPPNILLPLITQALDRGIKVVTFDLLVDNMNVPEIEQDDMLIGFLLCSHLATQSNGAAEAIYINSGGFAPLVKRDRAWQDFKWRYRHLHEVAYVTPTPTNAMADTQTRTQSALAEHPETTAVLAMWDEFAKGAVHAIMQMGMSSAVRVYAVDISNQDIRMMAAPESPWVATVATDAASVGRLAIRSTVALIAGEVLNKYLLVEPQLITQAFLRDNLITNMDELVEALPRLGESQLGWYDWMEPLLARNGHPMPRIGQWAEEALRASEAQLRDIIGHQARLIETIRELSTPVMPVHDQILVLPLIGSIDSERSGQIMEALLTSVQQHNAEMIIIDITGVPIVDTAVANHLIQAIRAVNLLGAQCVLVGITPEVAQTVVQLGLNLSTLVTRSNLQAGIAYALASQGLEIRPRAGGGSTKGSRARSKRQI